jgi:signal transduction histidine kinase
MSAVPSAPWSEQWLAQIPACMWLLDPDLRMHATFGNAAPLFGLSAGQLSARNFGELVPPGQRASWISRVARVFQGETLCLRQRLTADAPLCSVSLFPVRSPDGPIAFAGGLAQLADDRHLAARILQAQEAERARLARLLHDRTGQYLTAAGLQLDLLHMDLKEKALPQAAGAAEVQQILDLVMQAVRELGQQLSPAGVDRLGLRLALEGLAARLRADFHGAVRLQADPAAVPPTTAAAALYRIAEEAAANAARHSGGSTIEITLASTPQGPVLEIRDNGQGFSPGGAPGTGLGLIIMEQYAGQAGIHLHIDSRPGQGTVVQALCSVAREAGAG